MYSTPHALLRVSLDLAAGPLDKSSGKKHSITAYVLFLHYISFRQLRICATRVKLFFVRNPTASPSSRMSSSSRRRDCRRSRSPHMITALYCIQLHYGAQMLRHGTSHIMLSRYDATRRDAADRQVPATSQARRMTSKRSAPLGVGWAAAAGATRICSRSCIKHVLVFSYQTMVSGSGSLLSCSVIPTYDIASSTHTAGGDACRARNTNFSHRSHLITGI